MWEFRVLSPPILGCSGDGEGAVLCASQAPNPGCRCMFARHARSLLGSALILIKARKCANGSSLQLQVLAVPLS